MAVPAALLLLVALAEGFADERAKVSRAPVRYVVLPHVQHAYDVLASSQTWAHVRAVAHSLGMQRR